jgi:signal transduction histidine kinase
MTDGLNETHRNFLALLAHELRNPLGAITGYEELLAEGMYGELDQRGLDALGRIRASADQVLSLLDGLSELIKPGSALAPSSGPADLKQILQEALDNARVLASARGATIDGELPPALPAINTDAERLTHTLELALGGAVRASPGGKLTVTITSEDDTHAIEVHGSALDLLRDDPTLPPVLHDDVPAAISTGPGLRLAMASSLARSLGGTVDLHMVEGGTILRIRIASLTASEEATHLRGGS